MTGPGPFEGHDLTGAVATVAGNAVHIRLNIAALGEFGGGINVYVDTDTMVTVRYDPASATFQPQPVTLPPNSHSEVEWWVWLLGVFVGGIVGPIVIAILRDLASSEGSRISFEKVNSSFKAALQPIKWPASEFVTPTEVNLPESLQLIAVPNF